MSLQTASLNSGSNGNCYYIGNEHEAVLIDAGISCRETERRMNRLSLSMKKIKAIFISHEHSDHIRGVEMLSKKFQLPVYITDRTLSFSKLKIESGLVRRFDAFGTVDIGALQITSFPKNHDAIDPHSFVVSSAGINIGVFTDIGEPCEQLIRHFKSCHAAYLEANYDEQMLETGRYPYHLKKRISGNKGHLSNAQALQLFLEHSSETLQHLFLAHLSKDNNSPDLVQKLFEAHSTSTKIVVASRFEATEIFSVAASPSVHPHPKAKQASLFEF
jgi:phosphoribosyl 1,2-cyclic phosphodiesterase